MGLAILIVDDDARFAAPLADGLRDFGHDVRVIRDGRTALQEMAARAFDAVVLERALSGLDGIVVVQRLRAADQTLPVVMLTTLGLPAEKVEGLEAGADDYVVKPATAAELNARLRAIVRGRRWTRAAGDTIAAGDIVISPSTFRAWQQGRPLQLSRLQFGLLAELVRNADNVLTRAMLIERVWGHDAKPGGNIVDAQIYGLRAKLAATEPRERIATVRGVGYMLRS